MQRRLYLGVFFLLLMISQTGCSRIFSRFGSGLSQYTESSGVTAAQWFPYILNQAQDWQEDAVFYGIPETQVSTAGESPKWSYLFYSANAEKQVQIEINSGFIFIRKDSVNVLPAIKKWTIDSSGAFMTASNYGAAEFLTQNPKAQIVMSLFGQIPGTRHHQPVWIIKMIGKTRSKVIALDANTGKQVAIQQSNY